MLLMSCRSFAKTHAEPPLWKKGGSFNENEPKSWDRKEMGREGLAVI